MLVLIFSKDLLFAMPKAKAQPPEPIGHLENIFGGLILLWWGKGAARLRSHHT